MGGRHSAMMLRNELAVMRMGVEEVRVAMGREDVLGMSEVVGVRGGLLGRF